MAGFLHDHILSQIEITGPSGLSCLLIPENPPKKEKEQPVLILPQEEKRNYINGGPSPPPSPPPPDPSPSLSSSGGFLLVLMHPTPASLRNFKTSSVVFSFQSHLTEGALECFHSHAFPTSSHNSLIRGSQARHSVKRWWRVCFSPPPAPPASVTAGLAGLVLEVWADCRMP